MTFTSQTLKLNINVRAFIDLIHLEVVKAFLSALSRPFIMLRENHDLQTAFITNKLDFHYKKEIKYHL
ncbi:hypothetical protein GCM10008968_39850 [Bacillus horti]